MVKCSLEMSDTEDAAAEAERIPMVAFLKGLSTSRKALVSTVAVGEFSYSNSTLVVLGLAVCTELTG